MKIMGFRRIALGDWEKTATGTIEAKGSYLEINTDNEDLMKFLCRCRTSGEVITNPVAWIGDGYQVFVGAYQVIHMDEEGIVLRKIKK